MQNKEIERLISEAMQHGIAVQDFLWGVDNLNSHPYIENKHVWMRVFQKRVDKIAEIDFNNPSALVELRKRILQQACLSIQALKLLDNTKKECLQSQNETGSTIVRNTKLKALLILQRSLNLSKITRRLCAAKLSRLERFLSA